jgi:hypothetical protein
MAKAILRIAKLKTGGSIGGLNQHCTRTMEVPNADPELLQYNKQLAGTRDMVKDVNDRIAEVGCNVRKNAVLAIEHLITASSEAFNYKKITGEDGKPALQGNVEAWKEFEKSAMKWLIEKYGVANVVNVHVHKDEKTPHMHAVVVPIKDGKLNARHFISGREKLSEMQDSFSEAVKHVGIERGVKGSRAKHVDIKTFYSQLQENKQVSKQVAEKLHGMTYYPLKIALTQPPLLNRDEWRKNQELKVSKDVGDYVENVKELAQSVVNSISEVNSLSVENKLLKQRTEKTESENKKLREQLKVATKESEILKNTVKFASKLEVNGKPFMEALNEHNKEQEKQQQKRGIKMKW